MTTLRKLRSLARQALLRCAQDGAAPLADADLMRAATEEALRQEGSETSFSAYADRRASAALELLFKTPDPVWLHAVLAGPRALNIAGAALVMAALASGIAGAAVGMDGRIQLLAPPLIGVLLWNAVVYLVLLGHGMVSWLTQRAPGRPRSAWLHLAAWAAQRAAPPVKRWAAAMTPENTASKPASRRWASAATHAASLLVRVTPRAYAAWATAWLHRAAAALALGGIATLYVTGLGLAFRAGWDSTFLSAEAAHGLISAVLGPAAAVSHIGLPDAAGFAALRFSATAGAAAAPWIHLWALTLTGFVVVPRLVLSIIGQRRARRLLDDPQWPDDAHSLALQREWRTARAAGQPPRRVRVLPLQYTLTAQQQAALQQALAEHLGVRIDMRLDASVPVGTDVPPLPGESADHSPETGATAWLLLAPLTATPERDTHGRAIEALADQARRTGHGGLDGPELELWLDAAEFTRRFGPARRAERETAWRTLAQTLPVRLSIVDLTPSISP